MEQKEHWIKQIKGIIKDNNLHGITMLEGNGSSKGCFVFIEEDEPYLNHALISNVSMVFNEEQTKLLNHVINFLLSAYCVVGSQDVAEAMRELRKRDTPGKEIANAFNNEIPITFIPYKTEDGKLHFKYKIENNYGTRKN